MVHHTNYRMSHFNDSRPSSGQGQSHNQQTLPSSIFTSPDPKLKAPVSNLTMNLMSSSRYIPASSTNSNTNAIDPPRLPPSYSASISSNSFNPVGLLGSQSDPTRPPSSFNTHDFTSPSNFSVPLFNGASNYIPLGHNTPTAVSTSYTSNYSYTPSFHSVPTQLGHHQKYPGNFLHLSGPLSSYNMQSGPTTNINTDAVNLSVPVHSPESRNSSMSPQHQGFGTSLPNQGLFRSQRGFQPLVMMSEDETRNMDITETERSQVQTGQTSQTSQVSTSQVSHNDQTSRTGQTAQNHFNNNQEIPSIHTEQSAPIGGTFFNGEPDHYMSYKEYLDILNKRDARAAEANEQAFEEHFNIVDFPVDQLITMLACLLSKIIETNDKLHPNHFDNTIAIRQKLKEDKKERALAKERAASGENHTHDLHEGMSIHSVGDSGDNRATTVESSDDEEDELKNRYLANVLAFHGTNVPGITLHAYLTRVLKYCPVTNEVFLSLLVYFDRIAKRANNLQKKKVDNNQDDVAEPEQLFVMDSYNIHRLIILGITVSSKFFSDIFYKNLRYAKVGGLPLEELNYLELQFLLLLDFKLMISVEDLQNYGDLLLKFWKREQLANEIVNGHSEFPSA